jgi:hypothetical protein
MSTIETSLLPRGDDIAARISLIPAHAPARPGTPGPGWLVWVALVPPLGYVAAIRWLARRNTRRAAGYAIAASAVWPPAALVAALAGWV